MRLGWQKQATQCRPKLGYAVQNRQEWPTTFPLSNLYLARHFLIPVARALIVGHDYEAVFEYESVSHRKYRTKVTLSDLVITDMLFEVLPQHD